MFIKMSSENEKYDLMSLAEKHKKTIIIIGLVGMALIFFSGFFKSGEIDSNVETKITTEQYSRNLEENLKQIVSGIEGAGETKVLVTLENGKEIKYATEEKVNSESSKEKNSSDKTVTQESGDTEVKYIIIKDSNGREQALAITEFEPTVKGVVVVCSGGEVPLVQQRIISAVTTALNISSKKVYVTKLSN